MIKATAIIPKREIARDPDQISSHRFLEAPECKCPFSNIPLLTFAFESLKYERFVDIISIMC